jgi:hypothetical protein
MATLNPTLTLTGTAADFGAAVSLNVTDQLTVDGDLVGISRSPTAVTTPVALLATTYGPSYVYLKNAAAAAETTETIIITIGAQTLCTLKPQEFAYFPWDGSAAINTHSGANTPIIEYALFEI